MGGGRWVQGVCPLANNMKRMRLTNDAENPPTDEEDREIRRAKGNRLKKGKKKKKVKPYLN